MNIDVKASNPVTVEPLNDDELLKTLQERRRSLRYAINILTKEDNLNDARICLLIDKKNPKSYKEARGGA